MTDELHVRFRIGEESFALPVAHVREIVAVRDVSPVPGAGAHVLGVQNLRGEVLPVFDLAGVMDVDAPGTAEHLLVAELDGRRAGLAIDQVTDVESLPEPEAQEDDGGGGIVTGTLLHDGEVVGLISPARMFGVLESVGSHGR